MSASLMEAGCCGTDERPPPPPAFPPLKRLGIMALMVASLIPLAVTGLTIGPQTKTQEFLPSDHPFQRCACMHAGVT